LPVSKNAASFVKIKLKRMKTALFISPHLDDVAFSCGGTFARLCDKGWRTILCTIFTKSVTHPKDFALACQLDKGLSADVDYMKLRRAEDVAAAKILNASSFLHLDFLEAPHRGYNSAAELFAGVKTGDEICKSVAERLAALDKIYRPELIFAPQGLGDHVDHLQTIRAVSEVFSTEKTLWYRDTPYAIRQPSASPNDLLSVADLAETALDISLYLECKIAACAAYASQINFQFGGADDLKEALRRFHRAEATRVNSGFAAAEVFLAPPAVQAVFDKGKSAS
jgi:LmbE family N-acetylglucosaminyl deacetylase